MQLNEFIQNLPENGLTVSKRISDYLGVSSSEILIDLRQERMNMALPEGVSEAMKQAVEEISRPFGIRLNAPWRGYESLRKAVSERIDRFGATVSEEDIFITAGAESAQNAVSSLFGAENTVLLPDPGLRSVVYLQQCAGRNLSFYRCCESNGFCPLPQGEEADLVFLSSPDPVTGTALDRETLQSWVDWANETDAVLIYDSSLSDYLEGEEYPRSIYEMAGAKTCAVELFSFEKGYGIGELKVAYVVIPASLSRHGVPLRKLWCAEQFSAAVPADYVMQRAAEALCSRELGEETKKLFHRIKKVARTLSEGLTRAGIEHVGGKMAPYLWAKCPEEMNSWQCFDRILEHGSCVVIPGSQYGWGGERHFRLSAFGLPEEAAEAMERFQTLFGNREAPEGEESHREEVEKHLFETL